MNMQASRRRAAPVLRAARACLLGLALVGCQGAGDKTPLADAGPRVRRTTVNAKLEHAAIDTTSSRGKVVEAVGPAPEDAQLSFIDNRLARASAGATEIVALRVWRCGASCTCPPPCVQAVVSGAPPRWLDVVTASGDPLSTDALGDGASAEVTGQFTGRQRVASAAAESGGDAGAVVVPELRLVGMPAVLGVGPAPALEGAQAKVVLEGAEARKVVTKVKDERPYLVVAGAFPLADSGSDEAAGKLFQKLGQLGVADAERHDSRAFGDLACCFDLVLAGRFADPKAAAARQRMLVARGLKAAYVKRGF